MPWSDGDRLSPENLNNQHVSTLTVDYMSTLSVAGALTGSVVYANTRLETNKITVLPTDAVQEITLNAGAPKNAYWTSSGDIQLVFDAASQGTGRRFAVAMDGFVTNLFVVDDNPGAGETYVMIRPSGEGLQRVSVGAADSGGAGYRVLRIPN